MPKKTRQKRVGQMQNEALADSTRYDVRDISQAVIDDLPKHLWECVDKYKPIYDEPMFCIVMLLVDDNVLKGIVRRKFYAWPFLPKLRANQTVWLYRKGDDTLDMLWSMPEPMTMAWLATVSPPPKNLERMKHWVDAYFDGRFYEAIRKDNKLRLETESEYLKNHAVELRKAALDGHEALGTDPMQGFQQAASMGLSKSSDATKTVAKKDIVEAFSKAKSP